MAVKGPPLTSTHPAIAADWHPTANGVITPDTVSAGSKFRAAWVCQVDPQHEVVQRVDYRVQGGGCQVCKTARELGQNNLLVKYPAIAKQWHPNKNGELRPDQVMPASHKRAWWQCESNPEHAWYAVISNRTMVDAGCPFCAGVLVDDTNSLASRYPQVAEEWHPTKNGELRPDQVTWGSRSSVWWQCEFGHEWRVAIKTRTVRGHRCPKCAGVFLTDENRLSLRFPEIAEEWHPTKNRRLWPKELLGNFKSVSNRHLAPEEREYNSRRRLLPSDVHINSSEDVWWQCKKCPEHVWRAMVWYRTRGADAQCPFCSGRSVCADNNLAVLYPGLAKQWHSRNKPLLPTQVTPSSQKLVWWRCFKSADHVWEARVVDVVEVYDKGKSACSRCRAAAKPQTSLTKDKRKLG